MPYSYPTVTFGSVSFPVYADLETASNYLVATVTEAGTAWNAASATDTMRKQCLVSATRWFDAASWIGVMTDTVTPQALAWPRTNVPDVDQNIIPDDLINASIELAGMLMVDPDLRATMLIPQVREQHAGPAGQSFFRPRQVQVLSFFPTSVNQLVLQWLAGGGCAAGAVPNDVREKSFIDRPYDFQHGI